MTDPETANRTYIGPMTPELVEGIIAKARARARARGVCAASALAGGAAACPPASTLRACVRCGCGFSAAS
jgi:carbamoylphosphate synthase large subunit